MVLSRNRKHFVKNHNIRDKYKCSSYIHFRSCVIFSFCSQNLLSIICPQESSCTQDRKSEACSSCCVLWHDLQAALICCRCWTGKRKRKLISINKKKDVYRMSHKFLSTQNRKIHQVTGHCWFKHKTLIIERIDKMCPFNTQNILYQLK